MEKRDPPPHPGFVYRLNAYALERLRIGILPHLNFQLLFLSLRARIIIIPPPTPTQLGGSSLNIPEMIQDKG